MMFPEGIFLGIKLHCFSVFPFNRYAGPDLDHVQNKTFYKIILVKYNKSRWKVVYNDQVVYKVVIWVFFVGYSMKREGIFNYCVQLDVLM